MLVADSIMADAAPTMLRQHHPQPQALQLQAKLPADTTTDFCQI